jgi:hypothetical protein
MTYYSTPQITDWQRQIITGTILGGSSVIKPKKGNNCYLSMRGKNGKWMQCKAQELEMFLPPNPIYLEDKRYFRWHFSCSPLFNQFHELFYVDGKKRVQMEVLDSLKAIGMMVWFIDAGTIKDKKALISVKAFGESGAKTINEYFSLLGMPGRIVGTKIEMDETSTKKLMYVIGDLIPQFLLYP